MMSQSLYLCSIIFLPDHTSPHEITCLKSEAYNFITLTVNPHLGHQTSLLVVVSIEGQGHYVTQQCGGSATVITMWGQHRVFTPRSDHNTKADNYSTDTLKTLRLLFQVHRKAQVNFLNLHLCFRILSFCDDSCAVKHVLARAKRHTQLVLQRNSTQTQTVVSTLNQQWPPSLRLQYSYISCDWRTYTRQI